MCGRFLSLQTPYDLVDQFAIDTVRTESLGVRYNVAPTMDVYAILEHADQRRLGALRWGVVPPWARDLRHRPQPINARIETLASSRMFATAARRRRCVIPADGFYEWRAATEGHPKQPFHLAASGGGPLAFAGVYTGWRPPDDPQAPSLHSCAIVTTEATGPIRDIHHRMPVMLQADALDEWLRPDEDALPHLLQQILDRGAPDLTATSITDRVNAVRNDGPELLVPGRVASTST